MAKAKLKLSMLDPIMVVTVKLRVTHERKFQMWLGEKLLRLAIVVLGAKPNISYKYE
jgi:hypothetical protein